MRCPATRGAGRVQTSMGGARVGGGAGEDGVEGVVAAGVGRVPCGCIPPHPPRSFGARSGCTVCQASGEARPVHYEGEGSPLQHQQVFRAFTEFRADPASGDRLFGVHVASTTDCPRHPAMRERVQDCLTLTRGLAARGSWAEVLERLRADVRQPGRCGERVEEEAELLVGREGCRQRGGGGLAKIVFSFVLTPEGLAMLCGILLGEWKGVITQESGPKNDPKKRVHMWRFLWVGGSSETQLGCHKSFWARSQGALRHSFLWARGPPRHSF